MGLNERSLSILEAIIEGHISSGEPIGSRTIAKCHKEKMSPATVRNVMADLEEQGYVTSPHTSAGRIPTDKGYRFYVDTMLQVRDLSPLQRRNIESHCNDVDLHVEAFLRRVGNVLSDMSCYTGVVLIPRFSASRFRHIEFVPLAHDRLLAIFVSETGTVQNKIIRATVGLPDADELQQAANYLNQSLHGMTIRQIRNIIAQKKREERVQYDRLLQQALDLSEMVFSSETEADVIIEGATNMLDYPDFADPVAMKRLFRAFEQKKLLIELLDMSQAESGVQIYIGGQTHFQDFQGCSLITARYTNGEETLGSIGVIGPSRMFYSQVVPVVDYTARLISRMLRHELE
ncbi:MAG: heat-inducible transcriptional repressor HrcA [Desulfuromonadaceae bacterium]|nr:heat-inducible transcriptional repressor HrcA [Desulfuromonadaceae bacterium]